MNKILIITYYWPPSGGPGVQRWLKFSKFLPEFNIDPIILTVDPQFAEYPLYDKSLEKDVSGTLKVIRTKSFELYSLYKKLTGSKQVPYSGFATETKVNFIQKVSRFIRGNFFIPDPRKGWNRYAYKKAMKILQSEQINTIITTGPPHSTHLIGKKLRKKITVKWIADLRDPWTDIFYYDKFYPTSLSKKIDTKHERNTFKYADHIIVVSNSMKKKYASKYPQEDPKVSVISNGYDPDDFKNIQIKKNKNFTIVYTGTMSEIYPMNTFMNAVEYLKENDLNITIVGNIHESFVKLIQKKELQDMFKFTGRLSHQEALNHMFSADLLLLLIPETKNSNEILTGKIFEYMASGVPIICIGPLDGDAAYILDQTGAGKTCDFKDVAGCTKLIQSYLFEQREEKHISPLKMTEVFNRQNLTKSLFDIINK